MSKVEMAIKATISYLMEYKEPFYCDRYSWSAYEDQHAIRWLGRKKFLRYKKDGDLYKCWRSKYFYEIQDQIRDMNPRQIYRWLIEQGKKENQNDDQV